MPRPPRIVATDRYAATVERPRPGLSKTTKFVTGVAVIFVDCAVIEVIDLIKPGAGWHHVRLWSIFIAPGLLARRGNTPRTPVRQRTLGARGCLSEAPAHQGDPQPVALLDSRVQCIHAHLDARLRFAGVVGGTRRRHDRQRCADRFGDLVCTINRRLTGTFKTWLTWTRS